MPERLNPVIVQSCLNSTAQLIRIQGHHVIVELLDKTLATPDRGHQLMEAEKKLRAEVYPRIEVFLEPKADMNALRVKLRGVKV